MRKLPITLTGLVLVAGLAAPAWADGGTGRPGRGAVTARHRGGHQGGDRRFRSASDDAPGEGRSHYDRQHHDDDSVLF